MCAFSPLNSGLKCSSERSKVVRRCPTPLRNLLSAGYQKRFSFSPKSKDWTSTLFSQQCREGLRRATQRLHLLLRAIKVESRMGHSIEWRRSHSQKQLIVLCKWNQDDINVSEIWKPFPFKKQFYSIAGALSTWQPAIINSRRLGKPLLPPL